MDCSGVHQTNLDPLTYNSSMNATYTNIFVERLDVSTNILETAGADFTNGVSYRTADPSVNDTMLSIKSTTTAGVIRCYNFNTPAQAPLDIQASFLTFNSGPLPFTTPNLGSVLVAGNSAGGLDINMNGQSISSIGTLVTNQPGLTFLPQANVQAISNTPINIPVYNGDHQILLRASPVPVIDTLVVQTQFIGSSTVRCSAVGNSFQWLGTSSGEVYCYDVATHNWTLVAQFNGPINALFYATFPYDRLYIGGGFSACSNPSTLNTYGNVAYISAPSTSLIIPDNLIWSGNTLGGFIVGVNAITGNGADFIYFGGAFSSNADNTLPLKQFACYDQAANVLSAIDNNSTNGFNSIVYNLDYLSGSICATGDFTNITAGGVPTDSSYCLVFAISGNAVSSVNALDGGSTSLSVAISGVDLIDNDGTGFIVAIDQSYNTLNYLMKVTTLGVSSSSSVSNSISAPITSFFRKVSTGNTHALTNANNYYIDGALATAMGNSYFTFNYIGSDTVYFNLQGTGSQWAFVGASYNNFLLGGGRQIQWYDGTIFNTGYLAQMPNAGATLLLNWNGTYYNQICSLGSPTSWGPYT
jgi:hypothetical protein